MAWTQTEKILRPRQLHGVRTPEEYALSARAYGERFGHFEDLETLDAKPLAYINKGEWKTDCRCGNWPIPDPDWGISICFRCGAVTHPVFPENPSEIEAVLLRRPAANRNWRPQDGETIETLLAENAIHGVP
jgi:hypothetical protein